MQPVRKISLALLAGGVGVVNLALSALLMRSGGTPIALHPLVCGGMLLGGAVLVRAGWGVRKLARGEETRMTPLRAANVLAAAQTTMLLGAGIFGYCMAHLILLLFHVDAAMVWDHALVSGLGLSCALVLVACGRLVEHWCIIDDDPDRDTPSSSGGGAQPAGA